MKKIVRTLVSCGVIVSIAGCSLLNPYVDVALLEIDDENPLCPNTPADMAAALKCAKGVQSEYTKRMGHQAYLTSLTGVALIPAVAYTTGIAINDMHTTNVTDWSLSAAALLTLSQWLSQPERARIYSLGNKAIQCAIDATQPFNRASIDIEELTSRSATLITSVTDLESDITLVAALVNNDPTLDAAAVAIANQVLAEARTLVADATTATDAAAELHKRYDTAPTRLVNAVSGINQSVEQALNSTIQAISSLPGTLGNVMALYGELTQNVGQFGNVAGSTGGTAGLQSSGTGIDVAAVIETLIGNLNTANANFRQLKFTLKQLTPANLDLALAECVVDPQSTISGLQASLQNVSLSSASQRVSFVVTGGSSAYVPTFDEKYFDVRQSPPFGGNFSVGLAVGDDGKPTAPQGSYVIVIADSNGKKVQVGVQITSATPAGVGSGGGGGNQDADGRTCIASLDSPAASEIEKILCGDPNRTVLLQGYLAQADLSLPEPLEADSNYGPKTRRALQEFRKQVAPQVDGNSVDEALVLAAEAFGQQLELDQVQIDQAISWMQNNGFQDVSDFQRQNDLDVHGFIGRKSQDKLCDLNAFGDDICQ